MRSSARAAGRRRRGRGNHITVRRNNDRVVAHWDRKTSTVEFQVITASSQPWGWNVVDMEKEIFARLRKASFNLEPAEGWGFLERRRNAGTVATVGNFEFVSDFEYLPDRSIENLLLYVHKNAFGDDYVEYRQTIIVPVVEAKPLTSSSAPAKKEEQPIFKAENYLPTPTVPAAPTVPATLTAPTAPTVLPAPPATAAQSGDSDQIAYRPH